MAYTLACKATLVGVAAATSLCLRGRPLSTSYTHTKDIADVVAGTHQMDAHVRSYIHKNLGYRLVMLSDGKAAFALETSIKNGDWSHGKPLLNLG
jgi:hypothetical protein